MTDNRNTQVNEARFGKLFDDTQAMSIQGYRADGTVVYWNAASEKIYGYSTMEALGQSLYDLIIPDEMRDDVQMHNLRDLGVTISLDDFGTGYASLAYLTQLPLDELKIDRAFVRDLSKHGKGELLTETLVSLGRSMNLAVIAEGVETHEQFERLQELGCEFFQGYLFGKPSADVAPYLNSPTLR